MPKVVNYFVRPDGVTLSPSTLKDVQYGETHKPAVFMDSIWSFDASLEVLRGGGVVLFGYIQGVRIRMLVLGSLFLRI